ncbi:OprO/OprP family phosphate-selective porin [Sinomicrobium weinanense]|uniref:Porin n=1 Tax=Sinomicrobium weinanense TaxID=2842200 RepID=A0A926JV52_9FLAO|nr:porin [Sinomicrobium weinanense]MBC9797941.1 porin [Sinomicrobium weinanense]MBU3123267.1 OprO/OprP family phosphate-selective porin [Sinomicrobium weinanense]
MVNSHLFCVCLFGVFSLFFVYQVSAQQIEKDTVPEFKIGYGKRGFELKSSDDRYLLQIQGRIQFRFATPDDQDPITFDDYDTEHSSLFKVNRSRLKVGGNVYQPWLKYYWEYELGKSNLLDFRVMVEKWDWLKLKVGQWKVEYSRERRISSGEQGMMDRSIINRPFTVDRQQGVELYGRLKNGRMLDFSYWMGLFTGTGRGSATNDDGNLMYFGRVQWNVLGEDLGFKSSDLEFHSKPEAIIALAGVSNRSPYTRFSQSGGGYLSGFEDGLDGQYRVNQYNLETAFVYNGFSWQSEWHHKNITDKLAATDASTTMEGFYLQAGYLANSTFEWWPIELEIAGRYARFTPDNDIRDHFQEEATLAFNWFFKGHKNKLTLEVSHFDYELVDTDAQIDDKVRFRLQWDISF